MEHRSLGASDLRVSVAGLGCNHLGAVRPETARDMVRAAFEAGVTFFDTAPVYGRSEETLGRALKGIRGDVVIATKFGGDTDGSPGGSREAIVASVERSLRALATDYVDVLQIHHWDRRTPIAETLATLDSLVRAGKVRHIGCSNFTGWQLADASWEGSTRGLTPLVSLQNEWSLLNRSIEVEVTSACERFGCSVLPYFPLAAGLLTGKVRRGQPPPAGTRLAVNSWYSRFLTDASFTRVEAVERWATLNGRTVSEVALSWLASHRIVGSVIAGATSPEQVVQNAAATRADLSDEELDAVAAAVGA